MTEGSRAVFLSYASPAFVPLGGTTARQAGRVAHDGGGR